MEALLQLQEEVNRLRSIWESKREIDHWSLSLPSLRQAQLAEGTLNRGVSLSSLHLTESTDLEDKGQ